LGQSKWHDLSGGDDCCLGGLHSIGGGHLDLDNLDSGYRNRKLVLAHKAAEADAALFAELVDQHD
jgi:hypothetical protein